MVWGRLRVLIVAPSLDGDDVGEVYSAFKWVEALSAVAQVTLLATARKGRPLAEQLPLAEVVTWQEPEILYTRFERFNAMAKPALPIFSQQVRQWVLQKQREGRIFDIAHQILPQAMRHPSPLRHLGIPYVLGPLGGGLETPAGFIHEVGAGSGLARFRAFDRLRLRHDPLLRASYTRAAMLIGVAPYVQRHLESAGLGHLPFTPALERGHGTLPDMPQRQAEVGKLRLLHVGRVIRTKGLRDTVRAMAHLRDLPQVTLVSAGAGEDLPACRAEAAQLGVEDRIQFLEKIPRAQVDAEYRTADVFCFPSFREPMGGVFFEAMEYGLPVIAAAYGGPDFIVDDRSGLRLPVETPDQYAGAIAAAIRTLAMDPARRLALGQGARARIAEIGTWQDKAQQTLALYRDILQRQVPAGQGVQ